MSGRRIPKPKPQVVIIEGHQEIRDSYNSQLRETCELFFITSLNDLNEFMRVTDFKETNCECIVSDVSFVDSDISLRRFVQEIRKRGFKKPIIAGSFMDNGLLCDAGASHRPKDDLKENIPSLTLQILGLN